MRKSAAYYTIFIGIAMIGMWIMFYVTNSIPELQTRPVEILIHMLAEMFTAVMLIVAGFSILKNVKWARNLFFISMGMLLYTLLNSSGYFIQNSEVPVIIMFAVFFVATIFFLLKTDLIDF